MSLATADRRAPRYRVGQREAPERRPILANALHAKETGRVVVVRSGGDANRYLSEARAMFPDVQTSVEGDTITFAPSGGARREHDQESFLRRVYVLSAHGSEMPLLDDIYGSVDALLLSGAFRACDDLLEALDVTRLSAVAMIGFLTITAAACEHVHARTAFFARARAQLLRDREASEVDALLDGLE